MKINDITHDMKVVRRLADAIYDAADNSADSLLDGEHIDEINDLDDEHEDYGIQVEMIQARLTDRLLELAITGYPDPNDEQTTAKVADALFAMNDTMFNIIVHAAMTRRARNDGRSGIDQWQVGGNDHGAIWTTQPASDL